MWESGLGCGAAHVAGHGNLRESGLGSVAGGVRGREGGVAGHVVDYGSLRESGFGCVAGNSGDRRNLGGKHFGIGGGEYRRS